MRSKVTKFTKNPKNTTNSDSTWLMTIFRGVLCGTLVSMVTQKSKLDEVGLIATIDFLKLIRLHSLLSDNFAVAVIIHDH